LFLCFYVKKIVPVDTLLLATEKKLTLDTEIEYSKKTLASIVQKKSLLGAGGLFLTKG
jgi:hypothetical protein